VKLARLQRLQARLQELSEEYSRAMVGSRQRVLVEGRSRKHAPSSPAAPPTTGS
jgi:tRNA-2-methylthio-N6-dimethylallyladenosine synthase